MRPLVKDKKFTIFLIANIGGHLTELLALEPELSKDKVEKYFISHEKDTLLKNLILINTFLLNQPLKIIKCFAKALFITLKYKPDLIITTGAEIAFPFVLFSKLLLKTKIIFIECSAQVTTKSITGKFCYPFADKFYVQWPELLNIYGRKAEFKGGFLCSSQV